MLRFHLSHLSVILCVSVKRLMDAQTVFCDAPSVPAPVRKLQLTFLLPACACRPTTATTTR